MAIIAIINPQHSSPAKYQMIYKNDLLGNLGMGSGSVLMSKNIILRCF